MVKTGWYRVTLKQRRFKVKEIDSRKKNQKAMGQNYKGEQTIVRQRMEEIEVVEARGLGLRSVQIHDLMDMMLTTLGSVGLKWWMGTFNNIHMRERVLVCIQRAMTRDWDICHTHELENDVTYLIF